MTFTGMQRDAINIAIQTLEAAITDLSATQDRGKDSNGYPVASPSTLALEIDDKTSALIVLHELVGSTPREF